MILSPHETAWLALHVAGWSGDDARVMTAVAPGESGLDGDVIARSSSGSNLGQRDHGLWQISGRWHGAKLQAFADVGGWRDPFVAAMLARLVWDEFAAAGKDPRSAWAVYNSGRYETFLPDAGHGLAAPFPPPALCPPVVVQWIAEGRPR